MILIVTSHTVLCWLLLGPTAISLEGLTTAFATPPFNLILGTSMRLVPECHRALQYSRCLELFTLMDGKEFVSTQKVPCRTFSLRAKDVWLLSVSYLQCQANLGAQDPVWEKLLKDILVTRGACHFSGDRQPIGFVTPKRNPLGTS